VEATEKKFDERRFEKGGDYYRAYGLLFDFHMKAMAAEEKGEQWRKLEILLPLLGAYKNSNLRPFVYGFADAALAEMREQYCHCGPEKKSEEYYKPIYRILMDFHKKFSCLCTESDSLWVWCAQEVRRLSKYDSLINWALPPVVAELESLCAQAKAASEAV
jgi:hypothetical protein